MKVLAVPEVVEYFKELGMCFLKYTETVRK